MPQVDVSEKYWPNGGNFYLQICLILKIWLNTYAIHTQYTATFASFMISIRGGIIGAKWIRHVKVVQRLFSISKPHLFRINNQFTEIIPNWGFMYVFIITVLNERMLCLCNHCAETLINIFLFLKTIFIAFLYQIMYKGVNHDTENQDMWHCPFHTMFTDYWARILDDLSCMQLGYMTFCLSLWLKHARNWLLMGAFWRSDCFWFCLCESNTQPYPYARLVLFSMTPVVMVYENQMGVMLMGVCVFTFVQVCQWCL